MCVFDLNCFSLHTHAKATYPIAYTHHHDPCHVYLAFLLHSYLPPSDHNDHDHDLDDYIVLDHSSHNLRDPVLGQPAYHPHVQVGRTIPPGPHGHSSFAYPHVCLSRVYQPAHIHSPCHVTAHGHGLCVQHHPPDPSHGGDHGHGHDHYDHDHVHYGLGRDVGHDHAHGLTFGHGPYDAYLPGAPGPLVYRETIHETSHVPSP
ncbi:hypothetical protein Hanom_Chr14g01298781 [Helianthus anomalus]